MKKILAVVIRCIVSLWSKVYTYSVNQILLNFWGTLYSMWVCQELGGIGEHTGFSRPVLLQGGGQKRIKIGSYTHFGHHCVLGCWEKYGSDKNARRYEPEIIIGSNCSIGEYCHITAINKIVIGDGLLTGRFVYIGDNAHGGLSVKEAGIPPALRHLTSKGEIRIGNNVWIGDKATILGGVIIGDNVVIAANAVILNNIPSNSVAAGIPAKVVKTL